VAINASVGAIVVAIINFTLHLPFAMTTATHRIPGREEGGDVLFEKLEWLVCE
jgi:hypothetical protein